MRTPLLIKNTLLITSIAFFSQSTNAATSSVTIPEIQGAGHISPLLGERVMTQGIVTGTDFNGFYFQDAQGDDNEATSDGMFVFTFNKPIVSVGDEVKVEGTVAEFIPGGSNTGNLSVTQLGNFVDITVVSSDNNLPEAVVIGRQGRIPPARDVISRDETDPAINLQNAADDTLNKFDPEHDGIDFYESLEGMRVTVSRPVAVSATRTYNRFSSELFTLTDNGKLIRPRNARTRRGGINLQAHPDNLGDQNPERVQIQFDSDLYPASVPAIKVGDRMGDITGIIGYSFGNFEVNATQELTIHSKKLHPETTRLHAKRNRLTVASYNVLNLSAQASNDKQRNSIAHQIANNLASPDIIALQEIQDNNGTQGGAGDTTTDASITLQKLVDAIAAAGGPQYQFFDVAPDANTSGGIPGGNIRNAFLYQPQRVELKFFESLTPVTLAESGITNPNAFTATRNPLLGIFEFNGHEVAIINNHLTSRFGSTPIFGAVQPFIQAGELEREAQVQALNEYVDALLSPNHDANIIVTGDLNTFEFTNDLTDILPSEDRVLFNLINKLKDDNVYTFIFEGNSQVLDHMLVTKGLKQKARIDIVHVNNDFPRIDDAVASDHEPIVASFRLGKKK